MFSNDLDFQKDLVNHHIYSSWQFIQNARNNIDTVQYCAEIIGCIIKEMTQKTVRWEQDLFSEFVEETTTDGNKISKVTVTTDNSPIYEIRVAGEKVDPWFLFDKLLRDFYQYTMNSFDAISQIANSGLLGNKAKKVDSVDFQRMVLCFAQQTYSAAFPKTAKWFADVSASAEFMYIEAINNRTKHTAGISNKLSMGILGSSNTMQIGPFFRKDVQHDKKELIDQLNATLDFLQNSWNNFLYIFCEEYSLDMFVENRMHEIDGVYQQKLKETPNQNLSYAYISVVNDFASMPNELYILLTNIHDEINVHECPFEHILVRDANGENVIGRYIAEESIGDDCMFHYRKYIKDNDMIGPACLYYEMKEKTIFYHNNPFFNVTAVSDDDVFLGRSALPF